MGGKWLSKNPLTERIEFLHIRRSHQEVFTKKWQKFTEMQSMHADPKKQEGTTMKTPSKSDKRKAEATTSSAKKTKGDGNADAAKDNGHKKMMQDAFKLKAQYVTWSSAANVLCRTIQSEKEWNWAVNNMFFDEMRQVMGDLAKATSASFVMYLLSHTQGELVKEYKNDQVKLVQGLSVWMEIEPSVERLGKCITRLQNMHKVTQG